MIVTMTGRITHREATFLVLDVGGVGFQIFIPLSTFYKLPQGEESLSLETVMIVREEAITMYGFLTREEKKMFQLLMSVTKIGPKLAIAMLSGIDVRDLVTAIQDENVFTIKSIPGVGLKTAERIILELKGKVSLEKSFSIAASPSVSKEKQADIEDVLAALIALGYRRAEAEKAVKKALTDDAAAGMESLVKASLKVLSKQVQS